MHLLFLFLFILAGNTVLSQASWHNQFMVKTDFQVGDAQTYEVTEFQKAEILFLGKRDNVQSFVRFEVVDTADGGYWIRYSVLANDVKKEHDVSTSILASLTEGLVQYFYVKDGSFKLDSASLHQNSLHLAQQLDSFSLAEVSEKSARQTIELFRRELNQPHGIAAFLRPLFVFEAYYTAGTFKEFMIRKKVSYGKLLDAESFPGLLGNKWESTSRDSIVTLRRLFTGDPVATAQFHKPLYEQMLAANGVTKRKNFYPTEMRFTDEYEFRTQPHRAFPLSLSRKHVSEYIWRAVIRIDMKKW